MIAWHGTFCCLWSSWERVQFSRNWAWLMSLKYSLIMFNPSRHVQRDFWGIHQLDNNIIQVHRQVFSPKLNAFILSYKNDTTKPEKKLYFYFFAMETPQIWGVSYHHHGWHSTTQHGELAKDPFHTWDMWPTVDWRRPIGGRIFRLVGDAVFLFNSFLSFLSKIHVWNSC